MELKAYPKINLFLLVTGRKNNLHTINTFIAFARDIYDEISIDVSNNENSVHFLNTDSIDKTNNTVIKVLDLLFYYTKKYFSVRIKKNIPIAGGMGGGSSDAGTVLRYLGNLCQIKDDILYKIALEVGADVPVCLYQKACIAYGIGEKIIPSKLEFSLPAVFINPNKKLLTADVFNSYKEKSKSFSDNIINLAGNLTLNQIIFIDNDLKKYAIELMPEIQQLLDILKLSEGCISSKLCGSGPTCFGIFNNLVNAKLAAKKIKLINQGLFVKFSWIESRILNYKDEYRLL